MARRGVCCPGGRATAGTARARARLVLCGGTACSFFPVPPGRHSMLWDAALCDDGQGWRGLAQLPVGRQMCARQLQVPPLLAWQRPVSMSAARLPAFVCGGAAVWRFLPGTSPVSSGHRWPGVQVLHCMASPVACAARLASTCSPVLSVSMQFLAPHRVEAGLKPTIQRNCLQQLKG